MVNDGKKTMPLDASQSLAGFLLKAESVLGEFKTHTANQTLELRSDINALAKGQAAIVGELTANTRAVAQLEKIAAHNADAIMEIKADVSNQRGEISSLRAKVMEVEILHRTCTAKDRIAQLEQKLSRMDDEPDTGIIKIELEHMKDRFAEYQRRKQTPYGGVKTRSSIPPIPESIKKNLGKFAMVGLTLFFIGIGATVIMLNQLGMMSQSVPAQRLPKASGVDRMKTEVQHGTDADTDLDEDATPSAGIRQDDEAASYLDPWVAAASSVRL
jgi:hypothetical protein